MRYDDCEMRNNGDGVKPVYQQREARNKLALKNLKSGMKGKLGKLSNLQVVNFQVETFATGTVSGFISHYNTTSSFPANVTDCIMFGVSGLGGKGLYYNVKDIKANIVSTSANPTIRLQEDSYMEFYPLQNIPGSTTSLGTKIPRPTNIYGVSSGTVTWNTTGDIQASQYIGIEFTNNNSVAFPQSSKGIRCSGLALKTIYMSFTDSEVLSDLQINFQIYVNTNSVSSTY